MLVVKALEEQHVLHFAALLLLRGCRNERRLTQALCLAAFFLSMFVTNDVAILTLVPLAVVIAKKSSFDLLLPTVLIAVVANLGSVATPVGNPQNLFLFSFYGMGAAEFFGTSLPLCAAGLTVVFAATLFVRPRPVEYTVESEGIRSKPGVLVFALLSVLVLLCVFDRIHYLPVLAVVAVCVLIFNRRLFLRVDYKLLFTFVCFFVAVGNLSRFRAISNLLQGIADTPERTYAAAVAVSQVISNVPAAVLLSAFTGHSRALFYGVNVGGLGTLVASLASLIAYRLFIRENPLRKRRYLAVFTAVNAALLAVLGTIFYFFAG